MYLFSTQFCFSFIPQGISVCSLPHTQVVAESTEQQVTLAKRQHLCEALCQNSVAGVLQLFTLHFCLGSRNSHLLPRLLLQSKNWIPTITITVHVMPLCLLDGGETRKISPVSQEASLPESKTPNQSAKTKSLLLTKFDMMLEGGRLSSHMGNL